MTTSEAVVADNARTNRWMRRLAVGVSLLLLVLAVIGLLVQFASLSAAARQRAVLIDCTTAGPKPPPNTGHACYDRGVKATGVAISELRRSTDCVAFYMAGERPPACTEVAGRMDRILAGEDPFAPTPPPNPTGAS